MCAVLSAFCYAKDRFRTAHVVFQRNGTDVLITMHVHCTTYAYLLYHLKWNCSSFAELKISCSKSNQYNFTAKFITRIQDNDDMVYFVTYRKFIYGGRTSVLLCHSHKRHRCIQNYFITTRNCFTGNVKFTSVIKIN